MRIIIASARCLVVALCVHEATAWHVDLAQDRRNVLTKAAAASTAGAFLPAFASDDRRPVLVLGASGGTGRECVNYLLQQKRAVIAATRTGELDAAPPASSLLSIVQGDVTSPASMSALIKPGSLSGVIFAASASRQAKQSNAKAVDRDAVVDVSKLCIESEVPRLVLVSSGGVSKPTSAVYLFLNLAANGIMDAKISGENTLRKLYAAPGLASKGIGYTVVRPGGLTRDAPLGVAAVELNQGDDKSGRIARSDVAAICVECLARPAAFDTTFECYYGDTAKPLDAVMQSNAKGIATGTTEATGVMSGRERRADTWPALFEGLQRDVV